MRFLVLMFLMVATVACSADRGLDGASPDPAVTGTVSLQDTQICSTDGNFDFHVWGDGLAAWEGKRVFVAAFEPSKPDFGPDSPARAERRPVRMQTTIKDGSFSVACPSALRENYSYPSYTVVIDADDNGRCSHTDVAAQWQLYGWNAPIAQDVVDAPEEAPFSRVAEQQVPIGGAGSYCAAYFE